MENPGLQIRDFYADVAFGHCSDSVTDGTFDFLAKSTKDAFWGNIKTAVIDGIQILVGVAKFLFFTYKAIKDDNDEENEATDELPVATELSPATYGQCFKVVS